MSRKPPAASRSRTAWRSPLASATSISVDAASCGTWLTTATSASWCSGVTATTSAPTLGHDCPHLGERLGIGALGRREHPRRADEEVGARAVEPVLLRAGHRVATDEARARARARRLDRGDDGRLHRADVGHQPRAGVERLDHHVGDLPDRHRDDDEVGAGDRFARRSRRAVSTAPASLARAPRAASWSKPRTSDPRRRSARPIEPPIRPVPTRATRHGPAMGPRYCGRSSRSAARAFEVHVVQLLTRPVGVAVHEDTDATRHPVRNVLLLGAEQRDVVEPERGTRRARRELGVRSSVAVKMMLTMSSCVRSLRAKSSFTRRCRLGLDLGFRVLVAGDRAAQRLQLHDERG